MSTAATAISDAKLAANRANAQQSTGPVTAEGKAKSSLNATKTGLTGRTVLLPGEDFALYTAHIERHLAQYDPINDEERTLVQMISDTQWRLLRVPEAEAGFFIVGERKLGDLYPNETDPERHAQLMRTEIRIAFSKDLSNLYLQESRLNRQLDKYKAQLEEIQERRRNKLVKELKIAATETQAAMYEDKPPFDPAQFGFEFTKAEFDYWHPRAKQHYQVTKNWPDFHKLMKEFHSTQNTQKAA